MNLKGFGHGVKERLSIDAAPLSEELDVQHLSA